MPDTTITVSHNKHSKRIAVTARTLDGKLLKLKFKKVGDNKLKIKTRSTRP